MVWGYDRLRQSFEGWRSPWTVARDYLLNKIPSPWEAAKTGWKVISPWEMPDQATCNKVNGLVVGVTLAALHYGTNEVSGFLPSQSLRTVLPPTITLFASWKLFRVMKSREKVIAKDLKELFQGTENVKGVVEDTEDTVNKMSTDYFENIGNMMSRISRLEQAVDIQSRNIQTLENTVKEQSQQITALGLINISLEKKWAFGVLKNEATRRNLEEKLRRTSAAVRLGFQEIRQCQNEQESKTNNAFQQLLLRKWK